MPTIFNVFYSDHVEPSFIFMPQTGRMLSNDKSWDIKYIESYSFIIFNGIALQAVTLSATSVQSFGLQKFKDLDISSSKL